MNYEGVGCFKLFDGRLDSQRYLDILDNYFPKRHGNYLPIRKCPMFYC